VAAAAEVLVVHWLPTRRRRRRRGTFMIIVVVVSCLGVLMALRIHSPKLSVPKLVVPCFKRDARETMRELMAGGKHGRQVDAVGFVLWWNHRPNRVSHQSIYPSFNNQYYSITVVYFSCNDDDSSLQHSVSERRLLLRRLPLQGVVLGQTSWENVRGGKSQRIIEHDLTLSSTKVRLLPKTARTRVRPTALYLPRAPPRTIAFS
jgi:hypothetical protein